MITVIYISTATARLPGDDLDDILARSRRNNPVADLTGMLVYADGSFIQALEGAEPDVDRVMDRIAKDPRHRDIVVLARYPVAERQFPGWSMGFRRYDGAPAGELADSFFSLRQPVFRPEATAAGSIAHRLIEGFRIRSRG